MSEALNGITGDPTPANVHELLPLLAPVDYGALLNEHPNPVAFIEGEYRTVLPEAAWFARLVVATTFVHQDGIYAPELPREVGVLGVPVLMDKVGKVVHAFAAQRNGLFVSHESCGTMVVEPARWFQTTLRRASERAMPRTRAMLADKGITIS